MHQSQHRIHESMEKVDEAIALSAMYAANHLQGVTAIVCLTETGATPRLMSRIKSSLPIFAFSRHHSTQHRVALFRSEEHTSELQSRPHLVCRLLLEKKNNKFYST